MNIRVEGCFDGSFYFRTTDSKGNRVLVRGDSGKSETWTREIASKALDVWEHCYHYPRKSIRFV